MAVTVIRCWACTMVYQNVQVGPNFRVKVDNPVTGLQVGLRQGLKNTVIATTDSNGVARFRSVQPGSYFVSAHLGGDGAALLVRADGPDDVVVPVHFTAPILVRALRGRIRESEHLPTRQRLSFDLEAIDGRVLKSVITSADGDFDLQVTAPGFYFLSLKPSNLPDGLGQSVAGRIPVAIDDGAPIDHLDLEVGSTSCGLWYSDQSKCSVDELQVGQVSGRVSDANGAAIPGTEILLFDRTASLVDQLSTDSAGIFATPRRWAGSYQLVVSAPGFTPLRRTINVEPPADSATSPRLEVQLGVGGACSDAKTK